VGFDIKTTSTSCAADAHQRFAGPSSLYRNLGVLIDAGHISPMSLLNASLSCVICGSSVGYYRLVILRLDYANNVLTGLPAYLVKRL